MEESRIMKPFDALGDALNKEVIVKTKNGLEISGMLEAFDIHVNIALRNARFKDRDIEGNIIERKIDRMFIRGDVIVLIM